MPKSIDVATSTIQLQGVGRVPAIEAQDLSVGDTLMWNEGATTTVAAITDASPKFLHITEKSWRTGEEHKQRIMKSRLVARVDQPNPATRASAQPQAATVDVREEKPRPVHPSFDAPDSAEQALNNLATLLDSKPPVWPHGDFDDICVACYGPLYRWDPVAEQYRFQGRRAFGSREAYKAALTAARALTDRVTGLLGTEKPTRGNVRAALENG